MIYLIIIFTIEVALKWGEADPFQLRNLNLQVQLIWDTSSSCEGVLLLVASSELFTPKHEI